MRFILLSTFCLITGLAMPLSSGCKQLDLENSLEKIGIEESPKVPDRMVCVWIDDVRYKPGKPAMRGFGGRIMFYAKDGEKPVKVDGAVNIYAFDDEDANPAVSIPLKEFRTPKEVLPLHYSKSNIGHSYSFFLDWDKVGGPQKVLTLIVRFEDVSGKVVVSDAARQTLTGVQQTAAGTVINKTSKSLHIEDLTEEARPNVTRLQRQPLQQQPASDAVVSASYQEEAASCSIPQTCQATPRATMQTDTIDLPPSFAKSLASGVPQESLSGGMSRPASSSAGSWNTSVSYQRPTGFARGTTDATPVEIPNLGRLEEGRLEGSLTPASTATDTQTVPWAGQSSNRFLSPRYQALRERLRRPNVEHVPSQPAP